MVNYYAGVSVREGTTREEEAIKKGQEIVGSMLGVTGGVIERITQTPQDLLETKPVETFVSLLPFANKAGKIVEKVPGLTKIKTAVSETAQSLKPVAKVRQAATEGFTTTEPMSSAIAEQAFKGAEATKAAIKEAGTRAAEEAPKTVAELAREAETPAQRQSTLNIAEELARLEQTEGVFLDEFLTPESPIRILNVEEGLMQIEAKPKYLKNIKESTVGTGAFEAVLSDAPEVAPVVDKVKILVKKQQELLNETLDFDAKYADIVENWDGYSDFSLNARDIYLRMLAENVDNPITSMREYINRFVSEELNKNTDIGELLREQTTEQREVFKQELGDNIKKLAGQDVLQQGVNDLLTDSITPPAATLESYVLDPFTGKLAKGAVGQEAVLKSLEEGRVPIGEFERQMLEQKMIKKVEVVPEMGDGRRPAIQIKTSNPKFDRAVMDLADEVLSVYPESQTKLTPQRIASRFNAALLDQAKNNINLLRTDSIRKVILQDAAKTLKEKGLPEEAIRRTVRDLDNDVLRPAATENNMAKVRSFEIKDRAGNVILDGEQLVQSLVSADPKILKEARKQAILDLTEDFAVEAEYFKLREAIRQESLRFMTKDGKVDQNFVRNPEVYVVSLLERTLLGNEPKPVFVPFEGAKLANIIRSNADMLSNELGKIRDLEPFEIEALKQRVLKEADRFGDMTRLETELVDSMAPLRVNQYRSVVPENTVFENLYAPKEIADAFKWELTSRQAVQNPSFGLGIFQSAKRNLVARSLASLKNNNLSNYFALAIKTGDPLIFANIMKDGFVDFFITPRKDLPLQKQKAYRAIEASGLLDTTETARDLGTFKSSPVGRDTVRFFKGEDAAKAFESTKTFDVLQTFNRGYETAARALETAYAKAGDIPFKVQQAYSAYNRITESANLLEKGYNIQSPVSKNAFLRLAKVGDDSFRAELVNNKGVKLPNFNAISGKLDSPKIQNLIGRAAAFEANKLLFDYGDVGTYAKMLRSYPVLNAVSGFYTWYLKSLDIPLVKRGMIANTLFPSEFIISNDPKVIQKNISIAEKQAARKALVVNAMLGNVMSETDPEKKKAIELAKKAIAFAPKDADTIILGPLGDVSQLYYNDFSAQVPFKASDLMFKLGADVLAKAVGFATNEDFERKLFPLYKNLEEREAGSKQLEQERQALKYFLKDLRGESYSAKDLLSLAGLGGNAVFNFLDKIGESEQQGKAFNPTDALNEFMGAAIGRTPWSIISNAIGGAGVMMGPPEEAGEGGLGETLRAFSPYAREQKKYGFLSGEVAPDVQNFTLYALAQIIGSGWRKVNLLDEKENIVTGSVAKSRFDQYLTGVEKELKVKLIRKLEDRAKQYKALADNEEDEATKEKYLESFEFFRNNIEMIKEQIEELLDKDRQIINKVLNKF